jgi:acyl-CoA synthetase (AMP-forming)/AMP-acid ligase II
MARDILGDKIMLTRRNAVSISMTVALAATLYLGATAALADDNTSANATVTSEQSDAGNAAASKAGQVASEKTQRQTDRVTDKVEQKTDEATDRAVDSVMDKALDKIFGR